MPITLGAAPQTMTLVLVEDSDFVAVLTTADPSWPVGVGIAIKVGAATWNATIVGNEARFEVDKAAVNTVIAGAPTTFVLTYVEGTTELTWGAGKVEIVNA